MIAVDICCGVIHLDVDPGVRMTLAVGVDVEGLPDVGDGGGDVDPQVAGPDGEEELAVGECVLLVDAADDAVAPLDHYGVAVIHIGRLPLQAKAVAKFHVRLTVLVEAADEGGQMTEVDCHLRLG